jgi:hypothetical protein
VIALPVVEHSAGRVLGVLGRHHVLAAYERVVAGSEAGEPNEPVGSGRGVA